MRIFRAFAIIVAVMVGVAPKHATADQIPPCDPPPGLSSPSFPNEIPIGLRNALRDKFGYIAQPGEAFDSTDVVLIGKRRRAIFAWTRGITWVIATEHGGIAYNDPVFVFELNADGSEAKLVAEKIAFPQTVCATAIKLIER
jgi:hypothetical protein